MAGDLIPFCFDGSEVRAVVVDGEPHFVGKDVAELLGYADPTNAMKQHCRGVVKRHPIVDALGRTQEARVLGEADVIRMIIGSKLPAAERFERWVVEEVLPSIRKTGGYMVAAADETVEELALRAMRVLEAAVTRQRRDIQVLAPKAAALDRLAASTGSLNITSTAKVLKIPPGKLFERMDRLGWIYRRQPGAPWVAYQARIDAGLLEHAEYPDGRRPDRTFSVVMVTPRGRAKLADLIERDRLAEAQRAA